MSASEGACEGDGEEAEAGGHKKPPGGYAITHNSNNSAAGWFPPSTTYTSDEENDQHDDDDLEDGLDEAEQSARGFIAIFARKRLYEAHHFFKALLATLGGVIFWVGSWNLLDVYILPTNVWSELGCVMVGALILFATRTFSQHAGLMVSPPPLEYEDLDAETGSSIKRCLALLWKRKTRVYLRSFLALWGSVILWKGVYNLFDVYVFRDTFARTMTYVFVGLFLLTITDTLSSNVGLSPVSIATIVAPPQPTQGSDQVVATRMAKHKSLKKHSRFRSNEQDLHARRETEEDSPLGSYQS